MTVPFKFFSAILIAAAVSGCVVTQYKNEKGEECTRRYFTVCGISTHRCSKGAAASLTEAAQGTAINVPSAVPASPESDIEKAMEQEIKSAEKIAVIPEEKPEDKETSAVLGTPASRSAAANAIRQNIRSTARVR